MTDPRTGPELFRDSRTELLAAFEQSDKERQDQNLMFALIGAIHAQTAATVLLAEIQAGAHGIRNRELEVWNEVIPGPPLVECWGKEVRRPECAERHTEDCAYADPIPEPKHKLLPIGTRVLVSDWERDDDDNVRLMNPQAGRISGYDMHRTKYRWQREYSTGNYATHESWAFADNRVEVHPDGPAHPEPQKD